MMFAWAKDLIAVLATPKTAVPPQAYWEQQAQRQARSDELWQAVLDAREKAKPWAYLSAYERAAADYEKNHHDYLTAYTEACERTP